MTEAPRLPGFEEYLQRNLYHLAENMSVACLGFANELGLGADARFGLFIRLLLSVNAGAQKDAIDNEDGCRLQ